MLNNFKLLLVFLKITCNHSLINFFIIFFLAVFTFAFETLSIFSVAPLISTLSGNQFEFDMEFLIIYLVLMT